MANFSEVVDSGYSCPKSMNLRIDFEEGVALDDNKKVIFRMEQYFSHRRRRVLLDASSNSICILHKKKSSMHGRWKVRKSDTSQLSFIVKKSSRSTSREHIDLDVFLPNNTEESFCKIKANRKKKSCEIYASGSTLANANMENKNAMKVEIEANVDHAFIVALLLIVDVKYNKNLEKVGEGIVTAMSKIVGVAGLVVGIVEIVASS